ncbi:MAG: hypothetical protein ABWY82_19195 [Tardiphaga sp.]
MFKKLALLAAAAVLYTAAPTAPAAAQGINVQIGGGGGGYHRDRGFRGPGYRHSRNEFRGPRYHRGYDRRGPRGRTIVVR